MKALVKYKEGSGMDTLKYMDIAEPVPKDDELKIKILAAGICGTDIHIMKNEFLNTPPVVLGHEFIGIVCDKGKDVENFEIGDHVVSLTAIRTCGECSFCYKDLRMLCPNRQSIGVTNNGAMAEYMVVPYNVAFKVPETVKDKESLVISEPAVCAVRSVIERSGMKAGDVVLVSGPGTMGQLVMQSAKIAGAYVIVNGLPADEERLTLAKKTGADNVVTNIEELSEILYREAPDGADVVFECSGAESSARLCTQFVKKTGIYTQVGLYGREVKFDLDKLLTKEVTVTNNMATERTSWEIFIRLIKQGKYNLAPLISNKLPLANWEQGFGHAIKQEGFKTILIP